APDMTAAISLGSVTLMMRTDPPRPASTAPPPAYFPPPVLPPLAAELTLSSQSYPTRRAAEALITYSPADKRDGIESQRLVPGPNTRPPAANPNTWPSTPAPAPLPVPPVRARSASALVAATTRSLISAFIP